MSDRLLPMHTTRAAVIQFIADRIKDLDLTPRGISVSLGKSPTYLADFMGKKASPKVLDEDTRRDLAKILDTPEDNLRFQRHTVRSALGITPQNVSAADKKGRSIKRRANDMSLKDVYKELGKLDLRIAQLEADQGSVRQPAKRKSRTRPL